MQYNQIYNPDITKDDLKLIGWIALTDRTLSAEQLHALSKKLTNRMEELQDRDGKSN